MSEENVSQRPQSKMKSLKAYASRVLQESTVGIVSSIAQAESKCRKVFKVFVFLLCLTGFLYQGVKYLSVVFQFPTSIGIHVTRPNKLIIPAYTFCDNNSINRRVFCEKYPDRCEEPSDDLCRQYPDYCGENRTLVPKKGYFLLQDKPFALKELITLNESNRPFIDEQWGTSEKITGPHIRLKDHASYSGYLCYNLNDRVNSSLYPGTFTPDSISRRAVDQISLNIRHDEMFLPGNKAGILFALHSPFQAVNPFDTGTFLKTGRSYMVYVTMEEHILEKSPYDTDCINYTEVWEKNGRSGPQTQEMCRHNCFSDISVKCYECNLLNFYFPRHEETCYFDEEVMRDIIKNNCPDPNRIIEMIEECKLKCKDDCREIKFRYTVQERFKGHYDETGDKILGIENVINIHVYFEGDEVKVFKHSPRYMTVEAFSAIGGFIGIWLGLSLLDVADIFEALCRIFLYSFKKTS